MPENEDIHFLPACHLACSVCGARIGQAIHICADGLPPHQGEAWCVNLCEQCAGRIAVLYQSFANAREIVPDDFPW